MQAAADQICWVPIGDILAPEDAPTARGNDAILVASRGDGRYTLLAGQGKLESLKEQGCCYAAAVLSPRSELDKRLSRLVDDLMRGRLHYLDEAQAYRSFVRGDGMSASELAERTGRSVQTVRRKIRLLNLGEEVCALLKQYGLNERIAEALLRVPGQQGRLMAARHVAERGLDAKEAETLVDDLLSRMPIPMNGGRRFKPLIRDYRLYLNAIRGVVEQMRDVGLEANMQVNVGRAAVDVRISVPLFTQHKG